MAATYQLSGENSGANITGEAQKLCLDTLSQDHRTLIIRAIGNVLRTDIAQITYAQILDGVPLPSVLDEAAVEPLFSVDHPIYQHERLCPGVMEKTKLLQAQFNVETLQFESALLFTFQAASPGSRSFNRYMIEIVARAVHQIAVILFEYGERGHKDDKITLWNPPKDDEAFWRFNPNGPPPTLFSHAWYMDYGQYPNGAGDMVGYWAEGQILGGVVVFDRTEPESTDVYLHPDRDRVTYRICRLLDTQKQDLVVFLLSESPQTCPLPILPDRNNIHRIDPEEPITATGVYRDTWERKLQPEFMGDGRLHTARDSLNYLTMNEQSGARYRAKILYRERCLQFDGSPDDDGDA